MVSRLALDAVRRGNRLLWSPTTADAPARAVIRAVGSGLDADRPAAASLLEKAWAELARAAALSGNHARLRALMREGAAPYAVIGDSHSRLLVRRSRRANGAWLVPLWWLETGASARGLGRSDARSGAGERVRAAIDQALGTDGAMPILVKFGQVDLEFVQPFKRLEAGQQAFDPVRFKAFTDETLSRYLAFLSRAIAPEDRARVHLCSLFPPALSDAAWRTGYVNAHIAELHGPADQDSLVQRLANLEIPDLAARTGLHADFNAALASAAAAEGFATADDFTPFLNGAGVVDPRYLNPAAGVDHHLDFHASRAPVVDQIWRLFEGSPDNRGRHAP
uniref:Uncharacterized protein n=1 Tax=Caulobacter sp. (strain K31) TaxID=366602 RepID=B0T7B8_CAUSK